MPILLPSVTPHQQSKMANLKLLTPQLARLALCVCLVLVSGTLNAQNRAAAPSQTPAAKPGPADAKSQLTDDQSQETLSKLKDRISIVANQVIGRIQREENGLRVKFSSLRTPERLDPNAYKSRDELAPWRESVQQLKENVNLLERLYAGIDQDLGNGLTQQRIHREVAEQIKTELLKSFPWSTIKKKNELMQEFIAENDELLAFYDANWGSWKPGPTIGTPIFEERQQATAYQNLKEKINATGLQIEEQYKAMIK